MINHALYFTIYEQLSKKFIQNGINDCCTLVGAWSIIYPSNTITTVQTGMI